MIEHCDAGLALRYLNEQLGVHPSADFRGVLWVPDEYRNMLSRPEHVAVAVGYNGFVGKTCCMHVVITRPELVTPRVVRRAFEYPFEKADCVAVIALVDSDNAAALRFDTRLGFREVDRIPGGGITGDLVVMRMLRSECRWLRPH